MIGDSTVVTITTDIVVEGVVIVIEWIILIYGGGCR